MSATKLFEAGYTPLVSVIPPDAPISSTSSVNEDMRGKVPGKRRLDGTWVGYPFTTEPEPDETEIGKWESWGANIGLRADYFPGLDIDVEHPQLARFIVQEAQRHLGTAPIRTSRDPRRLLVYRTEEPFTRISAKIDFGGQEHTVEMLGQGRQYLVHGRHPSGSEYGWDGRALWEWPPEGLRTVTADSVREFFCALEQKLRGRAKVEIRGTGETREQSAPPQEELRAPSLTTLQEVVKHIPNDYPDRDDYIMIGHAIKAAGGGGDYDTTFGVFWEWCQRWEGTNEIDTVEADWERMHPPFRVGFPYLEELAEKRGGYNRAVDEFDADPSLAPVETDNITGLIAYSDTWVVDRLARRLEGRVRYVPETGNFYVWGQE